ncbi:hypothetical protein [Treponema succinifaciens]|uniref:hypothetical protein n=1 Tax=Treponema succinifaciens TaxID=167 RepID=UPI0023552982|nr:hypothetical protein [Treponema succinifaciens]
MKIKYAANNAQRKIKNKKFSGKLFFTKSMIEILLQSELPFISSGFSIRIITAAKTKSKTISKKFKNAKPIFLPSDFFIVGSSYSSFKFESFCVFEFLCFSKKFKILLRSDFKNPQKEFFNFSKKETILFFASMKNSFIFSQKLFIINFSSKDSKINLIQCYHNA